MTPNLVLAIDIGNTNTHTGLVNCDSRTCLYSNAFASKDISGQLTKSLEQLLKTSGESKSLPVMICSVVKIKKDDILKALTSAGFQPPVWLEYSKGFPVAVTYENAATLGADRLADCLYGFAAYPGKNQIIIDAGTAITVDFLKFGKEFTGGTILPGLMTQLKSLHDNTSALPSVELDETATEFPGKSTQSSMTTGVTFGTAGALSFLVERYRQQFGSDAIVLASGGAWKQVEKLVTFEFEYVKEMTVVGTGLYYGFMAPGRDIGEGRVT
jgi:type III pantothenate kinase